MMDAPEIIYHVPVLLRGLCYLGGMALYLSTLYWLARMARHGDYNVSLRVTAFTWFCRIVAACAFISLVRMSLPGELLARPARAAPEAAILLLLTALFLMTARKRFVRQIHVLNTRLPLEIIKLAGVTAFSLAGLLAAVCIWRVAVYVLPPDWAFFATGLLMLVPLVLLFLKAQRAEMTESLRFYHLLWPVLIACLFFMAPDLIELIANSPKFIEFLHGQPRLQKV